MVKTTNLLNLIVIGITALSFLNVISLGRNFAFGPVSSIFGFAIISLLLSKYNFTKWSFLLFTLYVNLSVFYFCKRHPFETENYVYYFPVIVSVVLLNNPSFRDKFSLLHMVICACFFAATVTLQLPQL